MSFHLYRINELYSNADGSVQFIELVVGNFNGESFLQGQTISVTQVSTTSPPPPPPPPRPPYYYAIGDTTHTYTFTSNLPSTLTANTSVLIATQGFANLGIVKPDYIVPSGFLFIDGGTVNYAGVDSVTYSALPTDGTSSINRSGTIGVNSPTDFAGFTGTIPGNPIAGTDSADTLTGMGSNDYIAGVGGNDTLTGGAANDTLDGGSGIDTAVFGGNRAASTITKTTPGYTVSGSEGSDTLSNIERLQFSDKKLALDLDLGAAGGNTVRIIGAAFDAPNIQQHPDWVGIGLNFFDGGKSMLEVCQLVVQILGFSNTAFVNTVYQNVVGVAPSAADRDFFVGLLQGSGGTMTQADLLVLAANADVNAVNINLVGLQQSGVEFV